MSHNTSSSENLTIYVILNPKHTPKPVIREQSLVFNLLTLTPYPIYRASILSATVYHIFKQNLDEMFTEISLYDTDSVPLFQLVQDKITEKNLTKGQQFEMIESFELRDPLTLKRIKVPARSENCRHLQCFDLHTFLAGRAKKCPVCTVRVKYEDLIVDQNLLRHIKEQGTGFDTGVRVVADGKNTTVEQSCLTKQDEKEKKAKPDDLNKLIIEMVREVSKNKDFLTKLEKNQPEKIEQIFQLVQGADFVQILKSVLLETLDIQASCLFNKNNRKKEDYKVQDYLKEIYEETSLFFIPFLFYSHISERNLVKIIIQLSQEEKSLNLQVPTVLEAGAYFILKQVHRNKIYAQFVYGKIFGYYICATIETKAQAFSVQSFLTKSIKQFKDLNMLSEQISQNLSLKHSQSHYRHMVSFFAGVFSWFPVHFTAQMFKKIFPPPIPSQVETLQEKSVLKNLIDNVIILFLDQVKMPMHDVSTFYRVWDVHKVVLKVYSHVQDSGRMDGQSDKITQFRKYLRFKRNKEMQSKGIKAMDLFTKQ